MTPDASAAGSLSPMPASAGVGQTSAHLPQRVQASLIQSFDESFSRETHGYLRIPER
jgi:hypothetical protein